MVDKVKPLLACEVDLDKVKFPIWVGIKLDGIRALVINSTVYSRSLKRIRNKHVQRLFGRPEYNGCDGELTVGNIYAKDVFQKTTSGVMSEDTVADVKFNVFDRWDMPDLPYAERQNQLQKMFDELKQLGFRPAQTELLPVVLVENIHELEDLLELEREKGGEGLIGRNPDGRYKYGRSTPKEQLSIKFKFFKQDEFEVVGFTERMHNTNEAEVNELGRTKRSSAQDGLVPMDTLGAIVLKFGDTTFNCGTGFTDAQRKEIWENQDEYLGKLASIRYMDVGAKDVPRVPSFQGWRDLDDL